MERHETALKKGEIHEKASLSKDNRGFPPSTWSKKAERGTLPEQRASEQRKEAQLQGNTGDGAANQTERAKETARKKDRRLVE